MDCFGRTKEELLWDLGVSGRLPEEKDIEAGVFCPHKVRTEKGSGSGLRTEHVQGQLPTDNVKLGYRLTRGNGWRGEKKGVNECQELRPGR